MALRERWTVVRVGGVIATMDVSNSTGPLPPDEVGRLEPDPGHDEAVVATLIRNVTEAERA